jgi:methylmalonyl-CoA mutase cobalamin-binding subunit
MATVEGDIHDIGKNIVCLMLKNHGFEVIDLGKDVPAQRIVDAAAENGASIIGLSALMTTTMVRMEDTVRLVRERGLPPGSWSAGRWSPRPLPGPSAPMPMRGRRGRRAPGQGLARNPA